MEFFLGGIVALAAAAFFLLVGAYFGRISAQTQPTGEQQQPPEQEPEQEQEQEKPLSEEEQKELAERLSRVAAEMAEGIAHTLGVQFVDFSQVFVGQWPMSEAEEEATQEQEEKQAEG